MDRVAGVDLGAGRSPTGVVVLDSEGRLGGAWLIRPEEPPMSVAETILESGASIVAIDSPLRESSSLRPAERLLQRCVGVPMLPPGLPGMRRLARAALDLSRRLARHGVGVLETYPAAAARVLRVERPRGAARHLADALLAALAALAYDRGESLGFEAGSDMIVIPAPLHRYGEIYRSVLERIIGAP